MLRYSLTCLLLIPLLSISQVTADPAVGQMDITNANGVSLNANALSINNTVKLVIPVYNLNQNVSLPSGSCKIDIDLGSYLFLDPTFNVSQAQLNNYFAWTVTTISGRVHILGDLVSSLPSDFDGLMSFDITGNLAGTSTISVNFTVTNHNTSSVLSDEDGNNNVATLQYTLQPAVIPVKFTGMELVNKLCTIHVKFTTEHEWNLLKYEIETSRDGTIYGKQGELEATNRKNYLYSFSSEGFHTDQIYVRIKSIDNNGEYQYHLTKTVKALCERVGINVFPNPVANGNLFIKSKAGILSTQEIRIYTVDLKLVKFIKLTFYNRSDIQVDCSSLAPGKYILQHLDKSGLQTATFIKL